MEAVKISHQSKAQGSDLFLLLIIWLVRLGKGRVGEEKQTSQQAGGLSSRVKRALQHHKAEHRCQSQPAEAIRKVAQGKVSCSG